VFCNLPVRLDFSNVFVLKAYIQVILDLWDEHSSYIYLQQIGFDLLVLTLLRFHIHSCFVQLVNLLQ